MRPALEVAIVFARAGLEETPPREPPSELKPFVRFKKLPSRALAVTRKVLDDDAEFREALAEEVDPDALGRAPWLFIARPEGWEAELDVLVDEASRTEDERVRERNERSAQRRLASVEANLRRAEVAAESARAEAGESAAALAEERRVRAACAAEARRLAGLVDDLRAQRDSARSELSDVRSEVDGLRRQTRALRADLDSRVATPAPEPVPPEPVSPEDDRTIDLAPAAEAMAAAATDVARLAAHLSEVAAGLDPRRAAADKRAVAPPRPVTTPAPTQRRPTPGGPRRARAGTRRAPISLPAGVLDDSPEAASHLVRAARAVLVVDGYNATLAMWPERPLPEQRQRLVDALSALSARTGCEPWVVFDGSEEAEGLHPAPSPRSVRVTFSAGDQEADEVIERLLGELPADRKVVVASSDRRVREDATRQGANAISSAQLASLLRR